MFAGRNLRRRIDDALTTASPLALAEAMDAHICNRSGGDVRELIERSRARMDPAERAQLDLYVKHEDGDDLLGHRFSAFLRQNPRAIAALDPDAVDAILGELGELPGVVHTRRRLSAPVCALLALLLAMAILPLAAQYSRQRGLLQGLAEPSLQAQVVPLVQPLAVQMHHPARVAQHRPVRVRHIARRHIQPRRSIAMRPHARPVKHVARIHTPKHWHHGYVADTSAFGARARLSVHSYLAALVAGNLPAALRHLGLPRDADTNAVSELPIVSRGTSVAILGSKPSSGGEQVQADIVTAGREYYEVFYVVKDGPAVRITDRYYIPVNRRAEIASRSTRTE